MNKNIAYAVVALFGVTLGLAVLSPAIATKPGDDPHKVDICHYANATSAFNATGDDLWHNSTEGYVHLEIDNAGKMNGHFNKTGDPRHLNGTGLNDLMDHVTDADGSTCIPLVEEIVGP